MIPKWLHLPADIIFIDWKHGQNQLADFQLKTVFHRDVRPRKTYRLQRRVFSALAISEALQNAMDQKASQQMSGYILFSVLWRREVFSF